ncbi:MAG: hypothetical protein ACE5PV_15130, partial [Candidatus Poribacteria bacterium]
GNTAQAEFPVLQKFDDVEGEKVIYEQTKDRTLPGLDKADILWIGQGEICENAYFFDKATEDKIKNFVNKGGIVISIGQDSDGGRPCEIGWLPKKGLVLGIERGGVETFEITKAPEVDDLFTKPNAVKGAHFDDAWTNPDKSEVILLATIAGGADVGIGLIKYGKGMYILTSLENESVGDVATNTPIIENLIHYAVRQQAVAVEPRGKIAVVWSRLKV